jgi:hypothetical protein
VWQICSLYLEAIQFIDAQETTAAQWFPDFWNFPQPTDRR